MSLLRLLNCLTLSIAIHIILLRVLSPASIQPAIPDGHENLVVTLSPAISPNVLNKPITVNTRDKSQAPVLRTHSSTPSNSLHASRAIANQFYEIGELDKPIKPLTMISPQYPESTDRTAGKISLDLYLDETGKVTTISVSDSTLPEQLKEVAVNAFLNKSFEQGLKKGVPVKVHLRVKVEFVPETPPIELR